MHGHSGPHHGKAAVPKVCYVEAGLVLELLELGREQDGAGELGGGSNGVVATQW
jgi:hypothetical protein